MRRHNCDSPTTSSQSQMPICADSDNSTRLFIHCIFASSDVKSLRNYDSFYLYRFDSDLIDNIHFSQTLRVVAFLNIEIECIFFFYSLIFGPETGLAIFRGLL